MSKYNLEERYKDFPSRIEGELWEGFGLGGASGITQPEGVQIRNVRSLGTNDDTQIIYAELMVDDEADLPAADSITGYLLSGCIALVVHTGDIWAQDSAGAWYNQTNPANPEVPVSASVQSLAPLPTLSPMAAQLDASAAFIDEPAETVTGENLV